MGKGKKKTWSGVYWGSVVAVPGENPNEGIPKVRHVQSEHHSTVPTFFFSRTSCFFSLVGCI